MTKKLRQLCSLLIPFLFATFVGCSTLGDATEPAEEVDSQRRVVDLPMAGFSIPVLDAYPGLSENTSQARLIMYLGTDAATAPNVNVTIQGFSGSIESYQELSDVQYRELAWEVHRSEVVDGVYHGEVTGGEFRFYFKAISNRTHVYLATATASLDQWEIVKDDLVAAVDGLTLR